MNSLTEKSIFIIREAFKKIKNPAVLWSGGKDSTAMLWLIKKSVPYNFKVIFIDTKLDFEETYKYRDKIINDWNLDCDIISNKSKKEIGNFECCNQRKTQTLKIYMKDKNIEGLFVGIRRDEHGIRNKERFISPRDKNFKWNIAKKTKGLPKSLQDAEFDGWGIFNTDLGPNCDHLRIHPFLHWSESEIWKYIENENISINPLYFSINNKRYRSIGCKPCTSQINSNAKTIVQILNELKLNKSPERKGRSKLIEEKMQMLRSLGYM